jgi:protein-tyrosine phosphatase
MYPIRPWLYIGKYRETCDPILLQEHGVTAMLQLAERVEQPGIVSLYLPVEDGQPLRPDLLQQGIEFVRTQQAQGRTTLVACGAGISRATTFALAAMKEAEGLDLREAWRQLRAKHPNAMPHPELWASLCAYYAEDVPLSVLWQDLE